MLEFRVETEAALGLAPDLHESALGGRAESNIVRAIRTYARPYLSLVAARDSTVLWFQLRQLRRLKQNDQDQRPGKQQLTEQHPSPWYLSFTNMVYVAILTGIVGFIYLATVSHWAVIAYLIGIGLFLWVWIKKRKTKND